jgi:hypothetical protein
MLDQARVCSDAQLIEFLPDKGRRVGAVILQVTEDFPDDQSSQRRDVCRVAHPQRDAGQRTVETHYLVVDTGADTFAEDTRNETSSGLCGLAKGEA